MDQPPPIVQEQLVIAIDEATYSAPEKKARITMSKAFQKSGQISAYKGADITLVYKDKNVDLKACTPVRVPLMDIKRRIDFAANTVTIIISNIEQSLADKIAETLCLYIDTEIVKKVSNPNYGEGKTNPKKPFSHLND